MANLAGYDKSTYGHMLNHYTRHAGDPDQSKYTYRNQKIDKERTHLNYSVGVKRSDPWAFITEAIEGVDVKPRGGSKATNVLSDWVVTLPRNELLTGREREFFELTYRHLAALIGEENIVGAYVHLDETQPHMHFAFVPIVASPVMTNDKSRPLRNRDGSLKRDRKGTVRYERVQVIGDDGKPLFRRSFGQSKMFDKAALKEFHPRLEDALSRYFGFKVGIELEDAGEKQLSNLEQPDYIAAKQTLARLDGETQEKSERLECLQRQSQKRKEVVAERKTELKQIQAELRESRARERQLKEKNQNLKTTVSHLKTVLAKAMRQIAGFAERIGLAGHAGFAWLERFGAKADEPELIGEFEFEVGLEALEASARAASEAGDGGEARRGRSWQR
jgi:hypothetical protein